MLGPRVVGEGISYWNMGREEEKLFFDYLFNNSQLLVYNVWAQTINDKSHENPGAPGNIEAGLGISRTNADSQWNPVYDTFHRFFYNETICRYFCKRDLDEANLRPALEQGCGKQTPGA